MSFSVMPVQDYVCATCKSVLWKRITLEHPYGVTYGHVKSSLCGESEKEFVEPFHPVDKDESNLVIEATG